jgi:hypothetical protein
MSECLMTIMSAQYTEYFGRVYVYRSLLWTVCGIENKKQACFSLALVVFSLARSLSLSLTVTER